MVGTPSHQKDQTDLLIKKVIGLAMKIHRELGMGFLESVYANAISIELSKTGLAFEHEKRIPVYYEEHIVGDFIADLIVEDTLILELKAVETLTTTHSVQLVNYLSATRLDTGLLINFGARGLQFKTKTREYNKISTSRNGQPPIPLIPSKNSVNSV
jgi:GxxExxY protein